LDLLSGVALLLTMICEFGLNSLVTREHPMPERSNRLLAVSLALKLLFVSIIEDRLVSRPILALDSESSSALVSLC
jgi:hypothetical protein